ncbi:hypothetical protein DIPPA_10515 [Diplonema papillatum]|nr:hypothetical protein DIPPA_10515 [Diplonema papillatum]KAJ9464433.1 hypothetical protein DIPPA_10515 [Diplonema papillatum]
MNVAGVVDDLLGMLANDRPSDPLKTMHDGIAQKVAARACSFANSLPAGYDVRDPSQEKRVFATANLLVALHSEPAQLAPVERRLHLEGAPGTPAGGKPQCRKAPFAVAVGLARSKLSLARAPAHHVSVVVPVLADTLRLASGARLEQAHNAAVRKVRQLRWLYEERADCSFSVLFVDDDCAGAHDSAAAVEEALADFDLEPRETVAVLRLRDVVHGTTPCKGLDREALNAHGSHMGGALAYGVWEALQQADVASSKAHVVATADASLSFNLGELGTVVAALLEGDAASVVGTRHGHNRAAAACERGGTECFVGVPRVVDILIAMQVLFTTRLLGSRLGCLPDIQSPIAAFSADALRKCDVTGSLKNYGSATLKEMLLLLLLRCPGKKQVIDAPVAWVAEPLTTGSADLRPTSAGVGGVQAAECGDEPAAAKLRCGRAWHAALGHIVDLHALYKDTILKMVSTEDGDWCTFASTLNAEQYVRLADALEHRLECKSLLGVPEPTICNLQLAEARALVSGDPLPKEITIFE